jgi:RNA polymerase sigma factor (sigma-70 family)
MSVASRDLQTLFGLGTLGGLPDGRLLERFAAHREEAAFEALVWRHGPMVWGVCRRILRDRHDAEDAFQATILVLARKGPSIAHRELVVNWLYGVAYQTALKARSTRARRRMREGHVTDMPEPEAVSQVSPDDLTEWLDRELNRLPDKYRIPIVLCDLEGKAHREAAEQLGWPIGTVSGRLSRAKAMLARRLSRRDMSLSAGLLTMLLAQEATASMPTNLISSTARAASLYVAGGAATAGVVSAEVAALTGEVMKMMLLSKIKIARVMLLIVFVLAAGGAVLAYQTQTTEPASQKETRLPLRDKKDHAYDLEYGQPLIPTDDQPQDRPESKRKLWSAITVRWPLECEGEATKRITIYFALVNDGDKPVAPKVHSSRLLINGTEYEGWSKVIEHVGVLDGKRVKRFDALPPGEELLFGEVLEDAFRKPGTYRVRWEGEGFRSPEIMFRVMPKKEGGVEEYRLQ